MNGKELKHIRDGLGLTQKLMAETIGIHVNSLARMERDEMRITETMSKLIRLLVPRKR